MARWSCHYQESSREQGLWCIYEISDKCLRSLDNYEGYPTAYTRINVIVFTEFGDPIEAITYTKNPPFEEIKPSREYLAAIHQGYEDWGIV